MRTGDLNTRMTLQVRQTGRNALNQPVHTWQNVEALDCDVRSPTGMGSITQAGMTPEGVQLSSAYYSVRIRFNLTPTGAMRLVFNNEDTDLPDESLGIMDIKKVHHDFKGKEWTDMVCELGANAG
jgi:head-tail adaptor